MIPGETEELVASGPSMIACTVLRLFGQARAPTVVSGFRGE